MTETIRSTDPAVMERCRANKIAWAELLPDDRDVYERAYLRLEEIGKAAIAATKGRFPFSLATTSGFSLKSGVRGSLPKDLWIGIHNSNAALGMPQIYMITSSRGVEYGFAPAIHTRDFSNQTYKQQVKELVPSLFDKLPAPESLEATKLSEALAGTGWRFREKNRLEPGKSDYPDLRKWLNFLRSDEGKSWGAGSICRYVTEEQLRDPELDLKALFLEAVELFAPLLATVYVPKGSQPPLPLNGEIDQPAAAASGRGIGETLLEIMDTYQRVKAAGPYGKDHHLWSLFDGFRDDALSRVPAYASDNNLSVQWGVGKGNWAAVPWISILDRRETDEIQRGRYVVFLFRESMDGVYLTLNQGTTELMNEVPLQCPTKIKMIGSI